MFPGLDANFRNLNDQPVVSDRVPLKVDNLRTQGSFNNLYPQLWNPETSRIHAANLNQKFTGRIIVEATPTVAGSILSFDIDIGSGVTPVLIYKEDIPLFRLERSVITKIFVFYISQTFLNNGGQVNVSCDHPVALTNTSLYLKLTGGSAA